MQQKAYAEKNDYFTSMAPHWDSIVGNDDERIAKLRDLFERINLQPGSRVMDIGCGNGILIPLILDKTGTEGSVTAVDASAGMIEAAKKKFKLNKNVEFRNALIENLDEEPASFDAIMAFAVFPHVEDKQAVLEKLRSLLKENGRLYIFHLSDTESLNKFHSELKAPVSHDMMPLREELEKMLTDARFIMNEYIDRAGLNFIEAVPCT